MEKGKNPLALYFVIELLTVTFFALSGAFFTSCCLFKKLYITNDLLDVLSTFQEVKKLEKTQPKSMEK